MRSTTPSKMANTGSPSVVPRSTPQWPSSHSAGRGCGRAAPKRRDSYSGMARRGPASGWNQPTTVGSASGGSSPGRHGPSGMRVGSGGKTTGASSRGGSKRSRDADTDDDAPAQIFDAAGDKRRDEHEGAGDGRQERDGAQHQHHRDEPASELAHALDTHNTSASTCDFRIDRRTM